MTHQGPKYLIPFHTRSDRNQHHGLGRHVNHDPRSRRYVFRSTATLQAVYHRRHVPIFDQGQLGSCEGNASLGIMATGPYWDALGLQQQTYGLVGRYAWNEPGAVLLYQDITAHDDIDGQYPPDDTGSDGLSAAKWLTDQGVIPGYQHTFTLNDALTALMRFPLLMGTEWLDNMFYPDSYGRIKISGPVDGGHAWILDEYVPAGASALSTGDPLSKAVAYVGGTTSWGLSFGAQGRFFLPASGLGTLLAADGDVIVPTLPTAPAPTPEPAPESADRDLATAMRAWLAAKNL
jgi:hypothetical protein